MIGMAKSTLPSLPSLSPTPPSSPSSSSAPTSPKESLPLQKKYAIVQEISKQEREKYGKMFIPTEFYATLRKKDEIPQQQEETFQLTKDKIKSRKMKYLSSKISNHKINYRRPLFEMVEKVHHQKTKIFKPTPILNEKNLPKSKDKVVESACSNLDKYTCEYINENPQYSMINKDTYADKTKINGDLEQGSQFIVEKLNPFSYKIKKIDNKQNKNEPTEVGLAEKSVDRFSFNQNEPSLSIELKEVSQARAPEEKESQIKPAIVTQNTRTQPEIMDSKTSFVSTKTSYYSKPDQVYHHIQPNIRLSQQTISHPPIRAASFQHNCQPRRFHPIVLEPSYHPFERTTTVFDPRFRQEPEYFPYTPHSGPIYKGQFPNLFPRLPYRHIYPPLQREPLFYHNPSMWRSDMHGSIQYRHQQQQYPWMDYYGYYHPHLPPPNRDIREMPPLFYP